ncbi:hypothetical protein A2U01_0078138, partial [Trifolium medium]|nr:hypothetical protein [Trifolium medium]
MTKMLNYQEEANKAKQVALCELCTGDHPTGHCPPANEEANFMGNQQNNSGYQRQ